MKYEKVLVSVLTLVVLSFTACGSDDEIATGVLVDSAVEGVAYSTPSRSGVTNASGEFQYVAGEQVTFSIGNIDLGIVTAGSIVFPTDLVGDNNLSSLAVKHMLILLQTLDTDGDASNGISISADLRTSTFTADLNFSSLVDITNMISEANSTLGGIFTTMVSDVDALAHFALTKQKLYFGDAVNVDLSGVASFYTNASSLVCNALSDTAQRTTNAKYVALSSSLTCADLGYLGTTVVTSTSNGVFTTVTTASSTCVTTDYSGVAGIEGSQHCGYVITR